MSFFRHRIALGMRHRDGSRLTEPEIRAVLEQDGNSQFSRPGRLLEAAREPIRGRNSYPTSFR